MSRRGIHAPNHQPNDGRAYRAIHNTTLQASRGSTMVQRGPGGTIHDYVPFYFGPLSPMLLQLKTGQVPNFQGTQEEIIYLVASAQQIPNNSFVFTDGHAYVTYSQWYDNLGDLGQVDWDVVGARYWANTNSDNDKKRRKQAEFMAHVTVGWALIQRIVVYNQAAKAAVDAIVKRYPNAMHRPVLVDENWYY